MKIIGYELYWRITNRISKTNELTWQYMPEIKSKPNYLIPSEKCKRILSKLVIDNCN